MGILVKYFVFFPQIFLFLGNLSILVNNLQIWI